MLTLHPVLKEGKGETKCEGETIIITMKTFLALFLAAAALLQATNAADPDPLQDFCVADNANAKGIFINGVPCLNPNAATAADFKTSALAKPGTPSALFGSVVTATTTMNLPGGNTQGLTLARIDFSPGGVLPPHSHPRATEFVFLIEGGPVMVGFVDTNNKLFQETLNAGDIFVFPRGLTHFLLNLGRYPASSISGLNSQNPGTSLLPLVLFNSTPPISEVVLEKSFKLDANEIVNIRKQLGG